VRGEIKYSILNFSSLGGTSSYPEEVIHFKVYNCLHTRIKQLSGDVNKFKLTLKKILSAGFFYSIEEFLDWTTLSDLNAIYL
jgi:hypothetical protein